MDSMFQAPMTWAQRIQPTCSFPAHRAVHHPFRFKQFSLVLEKQREVLKARASPFFLDSSETPNIPQHLVKQPGACCRSLARETD